MGRVAGGFAASYPTQLQKSMKAVILSVSEESYIFCRTLVKILNLRMKNKI